jgi:hypothetical protein
MEQLLHGSVRTTAAVRRAIQQSQESLAKLAKRYDLNPKTVAKWKKRSYGILEARFALGADYEALLYEAGPRSDYHEHIASCYSGNT